MQSKAKEVSHFLCRYLFSKKKKWKILSLSVDANDTRKFGRPDYGYSDVGILTPVEATSTSTYQQSIGPDQPYVKIWFPCMFIFKPIPRFRPMFYHPQKLDFSLTLHCYHIKYLTA